ERNLTARLEAAQRDLATARADLDGVRRDLTSANAVRTTLDARVKQLEADLQDANNQIGDLQRQAGTLTTRGGEFQRQIDENRSRLAFMLAPETIRVPLAGGDYSALAFVDKRSGETRLFGLKMPALKEGRSYQLWYVKQEPKPVSGGTFDGATA